ncbi:helix-turn-helix transcriptional regulator [Bradyrhizobium sp. 31Argb]|uniref:helix-turn-helix domain-containing protein n=1 Tax=Bradyrhizobium sp. 31Argb TaxID=3141247 RepID=UPI003747E396
MSNTDIKAVRDRAWLYLEPDVAARAGMSLAQLQQFVAGTFVPSPEQLRALARVLNIKERLA